MSSISVQPTRLDFTIRRGSTLRRSITWYSDPVWKDRRETELDTDNSTPVDLTGYTARMQIRDARTQQILVQELTTLNGGITLGTVDGKITFFMSDADTQAVVEDENVYDLELIQPGGDVIPFLAGTFNMQDQITV